MKDSGLQIQIELEVGKGTEEGGCKGGGWGIGGRYGRDKWYIYKRDRGYIYKRDRGRHRR